ncbi:MAG TPA: NAD(P)/FAD-dependent oxidoreductase [Verrucomicrobiae bacterium]
MKNVIIVGGGAAGFFAAIACAEAAPQARVNILERGPEFLQKVRISGGGRCNVTHHCFDPRELTKRYPRGERELISPYHRFQAEDTVRWFESRGVKLKVEPDGRMFPTTDRSQTIIDCLLNSARKAGVQLIPNCAVNSVTRSGTAFEISTSRNETLRADKLILAIGGARTPALASLATSLGHTLEPGVPSLFTFHIEVPWVKRLAGLSVPEAEASIPTTHLRERGPILFTHWGLSGPCILRLSAWGARELAALDYKFTLRINWLGRTEDQLRSALDSLARANPAKQITNTPLAPLPSRLWTELLTVAKIQPDTRWSSLPRTSLQSLLRTLTATELPVSGKSLNKDEFVTCGGVRLSEVNFKTMESKLVPGLYFAGELLDIDGITGGFNFQAAWTTGWIAGNAIAESL